MALLVLDTIEEKYINNTLLEIKNKNTALISNKVRFCKTHARKIQPKPIFRAGYYSVAIAGDYPENGSCLTDGSWE